MPAADFAFDGVHVFLTYPQCPLEREQLRDRITQGINPSKYLIARERHDDGNYHLHAYLHFGRRRRFTGANAFDVDGYHPNIQKPRSAANVIAYCCKEDTEPLANFDYHRGEQDETWASILEGTSSKDEFLQAVRARFPRDYVLRLEQLLFFCEWRFGRDETEYAGRERSDFIELPAMKDWVEANLLQVTQISNSCLYWLYLSPQRGGPSPLPCSILGSGATALSHSYWSF